MDIRAPIDIPLYIVARTVGGATAESVLRLGLRLSSILCIPLGIDSGSNLLSVFTTVVCNDALELAEQPGHFILLWWFPLVA